MQTVSFDSTACTQKRGGTSFVALEIQPLRRFLLILRAFSRDQENYEESHMVYRRINIDRRKFRIRTG
jgi:hypothetical protein